MKYDPCLNRYDLWLATPYQEFHHKTFSCRGCLYVNKKIISLTTMQRHVLWRQESSRASEGFGLTPNQSVWNRGGALSISAVPLSYRIRPQTFVMVMLFVCCAAALSLSLRDSLVSSINEPPPLPPPPPPICRAVKNAQGRHTLAL